jgi:hypothetical protein
MKHQEVIMKRLTLLAVALFCAGILLLNCVGCPASTGESERGKSEQSTDEEENEKKEEDSGGETAVEEGTGTGGETLITINIQVGSRSWTAILYDNAATQALIAQMPLTLNMSELNGNEKYNYLPLNLPTDSRRVGIIRTGDLMLYGSNYLVLFYKSFSSGYSYTPLGSITETTDLAAALGEGDVTVTLSLKD